MNSQKNIHPQLNKLTQKIHKLSKLKKASKGERRNKKIVEVLVDKTNVPGTWKTCLRTLWERCMRDSIKIGPLESRVGRLMIHWHLPNGIKVKNRLPHPISATLDSQGLTKAYECRREDESSRKTSRITYEEEQQGAKIDPNSIKVNLEI